MLEESRITPRTVYAGIGLFVALLVGLYFVYQVYQILLAFLLTLLFSIILDGPVGYLVRRGLARALATLMVIVTLAGAIWLLGLFFAPTVREQARQLADAFPTLLEEVVVLLEQLQGLLGLGVESNPQGLLNAARDFLAQGGILETAAGLGTTVASVVSLGVVVVIATVYLVARPEPWVEGFVSLFPAGRRQRVQDVLERLHRTVQRWMLGQLVAMAFIGVSAAVALHAIGIPFALLLGLFAGLIAFVPYLGAIVGGIPPVLLALISEPVLAVWVILAYTSLQLFEGYVIQPLVMSQAVRLHPALVLFAIVIMGTLFGLIGVLLAVPVVAVTQVLVSELWVKRMDRQGTDSRPPKQESGKDKPSDRITESLKALRARLPFGKNG